MAWDFTTDPEFQAKLDWMDTFVREEVEPLEVLAQNVYRQPTGALKDLIYQLKQEVRDRDLWACHLEPELGGQGYGQLKLALMNEILGRAQWAPTIFGTAAPDTGNAEIIAAYGTPEQKARWLQPLLEGEVSSCYSMTEPQGGADPTTFRCRAERDGDEWVINGEKFFSSNLTMSSFIIVMCVTNPDVSPYQGMSMILVPSDTPGINVLHDIGHQGQPFGEGQHAHVRYENVRVPYENVLGGEGKAFEVAQRRLGGGRIHHAMRAVAGAKRYFDMMCERAISRETKGTLLAEKQMVQEQVADSWIAIQQFRLLVLYTAWLIDQSSTREARQYIAACKVKAAEVLSDIHYKSMHLHGALGISNLMPFDGALSGSMGIMDGPSEVHKVTIATQALKGYRPAEGLWPSQFRPRTLLNHRREFDAIVARRLPDPAAQAEVLAYVQGGPASDDAVKRFEAYLDATANY
ncbi:MAG: acyl-CoA dehydrogenase family protein [Acidimicrobiia bacterium]